MKSFISILFLKLIQVYLFKKTEIANIVFIELLGEVKVEITLNFLGIFGSSSPMPSHFTEMVLDSYDSDHILQDFF